MTAAWQSLDREEQQFLQGLRESLWSVAQSPRLAYAVAALWLEREPTHFEVLGVQDRYVEMATELHGVPDEREQANA